VADALEAAQVDQEVDQGVQVGDGLAIAQPGSLDAEGDGLGVDTFGCRALVRRYAGPAIERRGRGMGAARSV
jgi:hypothetical protein